MNELVTNPIKNKNMKELIQIQNSTIDKLKSQIDIYNIQIKELNQKISSCDHLIIDYNSLNNNYVELEKEFFSLKNENNQLKSMINSKNKTISEFQCLFQQTKLKFNLYDKLNEALQNKINYLESQLKSGQKNINIDINTELNDKIKDYNLKIKNIKDEYKKDENLLQSQSFPSGEPYMPPAKNNNINYDNNKIFELQNQINNLKLELDLTKKINNDLIKNKNTLNVKGISDLNEYKIKCQQLKDENNILKNNLFQKDKEIKKIMLNKKNENEINKKDKIIKDLLLEKEKLLKKINEKEAQYISLENMFQKKYEILKEIVENIENEKNYLTNKEDININRYKNEISKLKNEINKCFINDKENIEKCIEIENKCKNIMENVKIKEEKYKKEIEDLKNVIKQLNKEKGINKQEFINNDDLMEKNKKLMEKNNDLMDVILDITSNFKKNEKDMNDNGNLITYACTCDNTYACNCCCCTTECFLCDVCCDNKCNCLSDSKPKSFIK